jgi:SAM-dependent methyltransferase
MPPDNFSTAAYWDDRYRHNETVWDLGQISPPLLLYFQQLPDKNISILIPGCGNSYEAAWLLENGFKNITLIDIAPALMERLREKFHAWSAPPLTLVTGDFFLHKDQYDLIIEQTFFCALDPSLRENYMEKMHQLLRPGGKLVGLLFDRTFNGGPPFGGSRSAYQTLLEKKFRVRTLAPCYNSIRPRAGTELFFIAEKERITQPAPADSNNGSSPVPR